MSEFEGREQVENALGRALTQDEIIVAGTIDQLSPLNHAVLRVLVRRQRLAALLYLRQVAPGEFATHLNEFINNYG